MGDKKKRRRSKRELRNKMHEIWDEATEQVTHESEGQRRLRRELRAEGLSRMERAARTQMEYELVIEAWDLIDQNREKKDENYLVSLTNYKMDTDTGDFTEIDEIICTDTVFPIPYSDTLKTRYWRQIISGDFHDYLHDCAYKMHLSTSRKNLSESINQLTANQKEVLYMIAFEGKKAKQIALYRNQTVRNIHKVYNSAIESIHRHLEKLEKERAKIESK